MDKKFFCVIEGQQGVGSFTESLPHCADVKLKQCNHCKRVEEENNARRKRTDNAGNAEPE